MSERLLSGWRYRAMMASVMLAALGYLAFSLWGGWHDVGGALARVGAVGVVGMLILSFVNYILRFLRWQLYLSALDHSLPWRQSARIYFSGFALTITPGKAGEALRGLLLKPLGVPYTHSLAAFVSERLSDLVAITFLALFGLSLYPGMRTVVVVGCVGGALGLWLLTQPAPGRWLRSWGGPGVGRVQQLCLHAASTLAEARSCHAPRLLAQATALSLVAWAAEALAFFCMLRWLGLDAPFTFAVFVYAAAMLAGALSFLPGGLGGAEAVMVSLLLWRGIPLPESVAATVLIRLTTLWYAVFLGVIALGVSRDDAALP